MIKYDKLYTIDEKSERKVIDMWIRNYWKQCKNIAKKLNQ